MTLVPSCNGIYFTDTPVENILTLTWEFKENGQLPAPYSSVIFKIKSSSPKSFYVHPRYGAILLSDASGNPRETCSAQVTFGLRHASSDMFSEAAVTTATPAMSAGSGYHERIAIEYIFIPGDRAAFDRLSQGLTSDGKLTEAVRGVWDAAAASGVRGAPINMKAYTDGVTTDSNNGSGLVVVPPTAKLVRPLLREQMMARMSPGGSHARESTTASFATSTSEKKKRKTGSTELRALKLGIDAMRQETDTGANPRMNDNNRSNNNNNNNNNNENNSHEKKAGRQQAANKVEADIIMRIPELNLNSRKGSEKGLPFFLVVAAMLCTYVVTMLIWRSV